MMCSKSQFKLAVIIGLSFLQLNLIEAQKIDRKGSDKNQISLGTGFLGLLALDEYQQENLFERKALPPMFIQYDRHILRRFSIGAYVGVEYEKQSGTLTNFDGPTTNIISGVLVDFHPIEISKRKFVDPYIGISFFYYQASIMEETVLTALRVGCQIKLFRKIHARINAGVGAALFETGIAYTF